MEGRYSAVFLEHLKAPQYLLRQEAPPFEWEGLGRVQGQTPGSHLLMWIAADSEGYLTRVTWKAVGMPAVMASTSALVEWLLTPDRQSRGMSLARAVEITPEAVAEKLGGLPPHKIRETVLGPSVLQDAIGDRFRRRGLIAPRAKGSDGTHARVAPAEKLELERVCQCLGVSAGALKSVACQGKRFSDARRLLGVSTGCGSCAVEAKALFEWFRVERLGQEESRPAIPCGAQASDTVLNV